MRRMITGVVVSVLLGGFTVAAAQLPPDIMADSYLLRVEQAIRDGDHARARDVIHKILDLQKEHELDLPDEFHFRYAKVAAAADLPEQALEAVVRYLAAAGREGEHYVEALELMNTVQAAASCKGWNTEGYFETATLEQVTACLNTGVDLESGTDYGITPLHRAAASSGNPAVITILLEAGANLEAVNEDGTTPLHLATQSNENPAVTEVLLAAGAEVNARMNDGRTPLHLAAGYNEPVVVGVLLEAGADPNRISRHGTPLHYAAQNNESPAVLEALIKAGSDLKATGKNKWTVLHYAAKYNENTAVIAALLVAGADVDTRTNDGQTVLHFAVRNNENTAAIETLIDAGADPMARDTSGWTVLHWAAWSNEDPAVIETLRAAAGEQIESQRTGLDCNNWNEKIDFFKDARVEDVIACLDAEADPNSRGNWDKASLHHAARWNEDSAVIEVLVAASADVNARSREGSWGGQDRAEITPLHWAGMNLNPEVTKALLAAGADVHARDSFGQTPLHWAAGADYYNNRNDNNRNPVVIELLLAAGADVNARNNYGSTPLHWAADTNKDQKAIEKGPTLHRLKAVDSTCD